MGKYSNIDSEIFSIFATLEWRAERIKTYPINVIGVNKPVGLENEFIRVSIIPSGPGVNLLSVSGALIIDIFTQAGDGPKRSSLIADRLDYYLANKLKNTVSGITVQTYASSLFHNGLDKDNSALFRSTYTIPFNYFEVQQ